ncbi:TetR/AcrR family transcriptional regulator [Ornithinimicrobium cryptoxanthini]|uniref:TetR/AcrR family transcriptional regulator n=1 Tax=Ornithinimicrobium cryptoxanthini TaxID=2934161 RepID=A0ABY4YDL3_9MICO|nr:TetR/AcrR family transcriptional regulator [Ornithinimicrobium cryptoxanthini]USQ74866.1 TetR/AcrR family transcriptional regulator [Ornithinimicrobium cryptoxanthini]
MTGEGAPPGAKLPRAQRREQILSVATEVFATAGFTSTGLEDVAGAAGISRAILYRHFESKAQLYRAVLDRARERLHRAVGEPDYTEGIIDDLLAAAARDPAGFRLLFHHAARESEFRAETDRFNAEMIEMARGQLTQDIPDPAWAQWAAHLAPTATIAAISAWLDAGQPDPDTAAILIRDVITGIGAAARAASQ